MHLKMFKISISCLLTMGAYEYVLYVNGSDEILSISLFNVSNVSFVIFPLINSLLKDVIILFFNIGSCFIKFFI